MIKLFQKCQQYSTHGYILCSIQQKHLRGRKVTSYLIKNVLYYTCSYGNALAIIGNWNIKAFSAEWKIIFFFFVVNMYFTGELDEISGEFVSVWAYFVGSESAQSPLWLLLVNVFVIGFPTTAVLSVHSALVGITINAS